VTIDGVWVGYWIYWPLVYTTRKYTLQLTDIHGLVSSFITVSTSRFLTTDLTQWRFFTYPRSGPLVTDACAEFLSTDNSTNLVPGWRPVFTAFHRLPSTDNWQLNFLTHQPATSRLFIQLNSWQLTPEWVSYIIYIVYKPITQQRLYSSVSRSLSGNGSACHNIILQLSINYVERWQSIWRKLRNIYLCYFLKLSFFLYSVVTLRNPEMLQSWNILYIKRKKVSLGTVIAGVPVLQSTSVLKKVCEISFPQRCTRNYEEYSLVGYDSMSSSISLQTFRKKVLPPSSRTNCKLSKQIGK
jgi:hypothetical protein